MKIEWFGANPEFGTPNDTLRIGHYHIHFCGPWDFGGPWRIHVMKVASPGWIFEFGLLPGNGFVQRYKKGKGWVDNRWPFFVPRFRRFP